MPRTRGLSAHASSGPPCSKGTWTTSLESTIRAVDSPGEPGIELADIATRCRPGAGTPGDAETERMGERAISSIRNMIHVIGGYTLAKSGICLVGLLVLAGCGAQGGLSVGTTGAGTLSDETPSKVLPLKAAYEQEGGQREVIFLTVADADDEEYNEIADALFEELGVDVLPAETAVYTDLDLPALTPVDAETGQIGVSLTLHQLVDVDGEEYEATVSFARSGLDGGDVTYTLERQDDEWTITDSVAGAQS